MFPIILMILMILINSMISPLPTESPNRSNVVLLNSVLGLWYILAGVMGLSAVILFLPRISKRFEMDHKNGLAGLERASALSFSAQMVSQASLARGSIMKQMNWFGTHNSSPMSINSNLNSNSSDDLVVFGKLDADISSKMRQARSQSHSSLFGGKVSPLETMADGTMILAQHVKSRHSLAAGTLSPGSSVPGSASQSAMDLSGMTPRTRQQQLSAGKYGVSSWPTISQDSSQLVMPGEGKDGDVRSPGLGGGVVSHGGVDGRGDGSGSRTPSPAPAAVMPEAETQIVDSDPDEL